MAEKARDSSSQSPSDNGQIALEKGDTERYYTADGEVLEDPDANLSPEEKAKIVSSSDQDLNQHLTHEPKG